MAKIGLPKGSGKRLKVREKSVKSQGILKWILSRVSNFKLRDYWFEPHWRYCVVSLSKTLYLFSTGSGQTKS